MKKLITLACLGLALVSSSSAFAGPQQEKMKGCNIEAKASALKGEERKVFMKKCLSKEYVLKAGTAKPVAAKPAAPVAASGVAAATVVNAAAVGKQQNKMKTCNQEMKTKKLKGEERRAFMATCLKS